MKYAGETSTYEAELAAVAAGEYEVRVVAFSEDGNAGMADAPLKIKP